MLMDVYMLPSAWALTSPCQQYLTVLLVVYIDALLSTTCSIFTIEIRACLIDLENFVLWTFNTLVVLINMLLLV